MESVARDGRLSSAIDLRFVYDPASEHLITHLPPSWHVRFGRGLERLRQSQKVAEASAQANSRASSQEHPPVLRQTG
jgi:hypothetical protein